MKKYISLLMMVLSLTAVTNLFAAPADVPETGQTTSFSASDFEDGDLQRGFPLPSPRFEDNENGTVTDYLTGLIWLRDAGCVGQGTWYETRTLVEGLGDGNVDCGLSDDSSPGEWRLPNILELWSLMDFGTDPPPALPAGHPFLNVPTSNYDYWSSSPYETYQSTGGVYKANFEHGIIARQGEASSNNGWAVRGESTYYSLDISMPGSGSGTVTGVYTSTSTDAGIYCRDNCTFFFDAGSVFDAGSNLSLTATADDDSRFSTWLGDCDSDGNLTLDASKDCAAVFAKNSAILMMVVPAISGKGDR